jgi:hypothetical protein
MLVGKINPAASFAKQENAFTITTLSADSIAVVARPYVLGAKEVNFEVLFGNIVPATDAVEASEGVDAVEAIPAQFIQVTTQSLVLNKEELENWGVDDEVALVVIATKLGATIESSEVY